MCGDVWDVKGGFGLVDVKHGVEKGNVDDVVKGSVVVESGIVEGMSDDESAAKIEIGIGVDVEYVEEVLSDVGNVNDENADQELVDVVDL